MRAFLVLLAGASSLRAEDRDNCLLCHQYLGLSRYDADADRLHVYFVDPDYTHGLQGPHARLACTDCHPREEVSVVPHAAVSRVDCTKTCHLSTVSGLAREFSHREVAERLQHSAHPMALLQSLTFSEGPILAPDQFACLFCHEEPVFPTTDERIMPWDPRGTPTHDRCATCHSAQLDVDITYALRHIAARLQPARSNLELARVCAVCHGDPAVNAAHGMEDAVSSYLRSFHGKAAQLGSTDTADCLSCHSAKTSAHDMLAGSDPKSSVHPDRVADACRTTECHPGASPEFGAASVHFDLPSSLGTIEFFFALAFILLTVFTFGPSALFAVLELLQTVVGRRHVSDERMHQWTKSVLEHPQGRKRLVRFTPGQRVQHWILALLFLILVVTGFPMKFADQTWARVVVGWFGGLQIARTIHHWAGLLLVLGFMGHIGQIAWRIVFTARVGGRPGWVERIFRAVIALPMWVNMDDARKLRHALQYWFFLRSDRPAFGRFSLKEKFEYIGVFWGTMLLGATGLMLWGEQLTSYLFSGRIFNIAAIAHTYEAFLAVIHVGILHTYSVILSPHVFPISLATLTGDTPIAELAEGHKAFVRQAAVDLGIEPPGEEPYE